MKGEYELYHILQRIKTLEEELAALVLEFSTLRTTLTIAGEIKTYG